MLNPFVHSKLVFKVSPVPWVKLYRQEIKPSKVTHMIIWIAVSFSLSLFEYVRKCRYNYQYIHMYFNIYLFPPPFRFRRRRWRWWGLGRWRRWRLIMIYISVWIDPEWSWGQAFHGMKLHTRYEYMCIKLTKYTVEWKFSLNEPTYKSTLWSKISSLTLMFRNITDI